MFVYISHTEKEQIVMQTLVSNNLQLKLPVVCLHGFTKRVKFYGMLHSPH